MAKKEVRINVRTTEETVEDLKIAARLRGLSVSSLVNTLVVKAIREERELVPDAFIQRTARLRPMQGSGEKTDWRESLKAAKGLWKDRDDLPDFDKLRKEWDRNESGI